MYDISEQLKAAHKTNFNILLQFAGIAAAGAEKLVELELKTAKGRFTNAVKHIESMSTAKSAQEIAQLKTALVQPAVDDFAAYCRNVHAVITQTQVEWNQLFEASVTDLNKNVQSVLDEAMEGAPAGSDAAVAAVKSVMVAANQAYGAFAKTTKQVSGATVAAAGATVSRSKNKNNGASKNQSA